MIKRDILNFDQFPSDWMVHLQNEFEKDYIKSLRLFLSNEVSGKQIYPNISEIFTAFRLTSFNQVKVVIIGQDPYHGPDQAHGLSFSVKKDMLTPPSLKNIFKEIESDLGITPPKHGHLKYWAQQGILLLNSVLTVEKSSPGSHSGKGWEKFTDKVIQLLNGEKDGLVFLLWGSHAHKKGEKIDQDKHLVLTTTHPSPLSAYRGFLGCRHFSKANLYLKKKGKETIDWSLPKN